MSRLIMVVLASFVTQLHSRELDANHTLITQNLMEKLADRLVNVALQARPLHHQLDYTDLDNTILAKTHSMNGVGGGSLVASSVAPCYGSSTQLAKPCFRLNALANSESSSSYIRGRKYMRTMLGHAIGSKKIKWPASRIRFEKDNKNIFLNEDLSELRDVSGFSREAVESSDDNNSDMKMQ